MSPKALAPLKTAKGYYERAWRAVIKANRPKWNERVIKKNLAWLWESRTQAEESHCNSLLASQSTSLPSIDISILPVNSVKPGDLPHPRAAGRGQVSAPAPLRQVLAAGTSKLPAAGPSKLPAGSSKGKGPAANPVPAAADFGSTLASAPNPNTTRFPFWPVNTQDVVLPLAGAESTNLWLNAGFLHQSEQQHEWDWHGAVKLGQGGGGAVTGWVKLDENDNIVDRMAVKDCGKIDRMNWTNAVYWRDYLPREIAIQKRVDDQGGLSSIHKFWGYRLSMLQRSYRLYNDFCALGAFVHAFEYYSKQWRMRRILYQRRIEGQAWPEKDKDKHPDFQQGVWKDEQFDPNDGKLTVIPEGFLWETFQHLVNACLVLRDGAGTDVGGNKSWHPIVHKDMHIGNVFLKLPKGCRELLADFSSGTTLDTFFQTHYSAKGRREAVTTYRLNEYSAGGLWPTAVLADYDTAFFDLQSGDDTYADNPMHYLFYDRVVNSDAVHGRYAPELFGDHEHYKTSSGLPKLTSQTDVFGIGSIMWNLVRNLPRKDHGYQQQPCFDDGPTYGRNLVNGTAYTATNLEHSVLTGRAPHEAPARYSRDLIHAVKLCLHYHPHDRASLDDLKAIIDTAIANPPPTKADGRLILFYKRDWEMFQMDGKYKGKKRKRPVSDEE